MERNHSPVPARPRLEPYRANEILRFLIEGTIPARLRQKNVVGILLRDPRPQRSTLVLTEPHWLAVRAKTPERVIEASKQSPVASEKFLLPASS